MLKKKQTADGTAFLEYNERQTKTGTGADPKDSRTVKPKMFAVVGSERDPVRAYDLYASKRPGASVVIYNLIGPQFCGKPTFSVK